MADTSIEWTRSCYGSKPVKGKAWNATTGCNDDIVSPGCEHCYARRMARRLAGRYGYPMDEPFRVTMHPYRLAMPLRWRKPRRIFVDSMGDLFHEDVPDEFIAAVFGVMAACPQHTFLVLMKRPERMAKWFEWVAAQPLHNAWRCARFALDGGYIPKKHREPVMMVGQGLPPHPWPLPNVWLGVTAEDQQRADARIPLLLQTPAAVRFVSVEPMLGQVWLDAILMSPHFPGIATNALRRHNDTSLNWVICGAETGPGARPMDPEWARSLLAQCRAAGVPFFFKKAGPGIATPPDLAVREWPEVRRG